MKLNPRLACFLLCAACALVVPAALAAPSVALVADVEGEAMLVDTSPRAARLLEPLAPGTRIQLGSPARVVLFYLRDGSRFALDGPGVYVIQASGPEPRDGAAAPRREPGAMPPEALRVRTDRIVQGAVVHRGSDHPALIAPVDEVVLDAAAVRFEWEPMGDAATYRFELVDGAGALLHVADTEETTLPVPKRVRLKAGQVYYWGVHAQPRTGGAAIYHAAQFRIADGATRRKLLRAKPAADASFADRVLYVALLEYAGAKGAARQWRDMLSGERSAPWALLRP